MAILSAIIQIVRHEDDGLAQRLLHAQEFILDHFARDRVEGAERLVHQHDRRIGRKRTRYADTARRSG
jgi:hypothetical protein